MCQSLRRDAGAEPHQQRQATRCFPRGSCLHLRRGLHNGRHASGKEQLRIEVPGDWRVHFGASSVAPWTVVFHHEGIAAPLIQHPRCTTRRQTICAMRATELMETCGCNKRSFRDAVLSHGIVRASEFWCGTVSAWGVCRRS